MDIELYNEIKTSSEYKKILDLGYTDITTFKQIKNGTLDFSADPHNGNCDDRFTIYCDKIQNRTEFKTQKKIPTPIQGVIRCYSYGGRMAGLGMYKYKEFYIPPTYDGFINALKILEEIIKSRNNKYMTLFREYPHEAVEIIFDERYDIPNFKLLYARLARLKENHRI